MRQDSRVPGGRRRLPARATRRARPQTWPITGRPPAGPEPDLASTMLTTLLVTVAAILILGIAVAARYLAGGGSAAVAGAVLLALFGLAVGTGAVRHKHMQEARARTGTPSPHPPATEPAEAWAAARRRFDRLREDYTRFECDPMAVLRLPALADVAVASTARFVDAFAEAQALDTDRFPGSAPAGWFGAAVDHAERAWRAARDAAERIRHDGLAPAERAALERVIKLLTTARDSDYEPERLAAYARARTEIARLDRAGVLHLPLPAQAALDRAARSQLPR